MGNGWRREDGRATCHPERPQGSTALDASLVADAITPIAHVHVIFQTQRNDRPPLDGLVYTRVLTFYFKTSSRTARVLYSRNAPSCGAKTVWALCGVQSSVRLTYLPIR